MQQDAAKSPDTRRNPLGHTHKRSMKFAEIIDHRRGEIEHTNEPKFMALAADVMARLATAFKHYKRDGEAAWDETARKLR